MLSRVESRSGLVEFKGAYGTLLDRSSGNQTLLGYLSSAHNPGLDASALHVEDGVSCAHARHVRHGALAVLLLSDESDASASRTFSLAPDRVSVGIAAAPVGVGLDAQVGEHIVGSKHVAVLHVGY